MSHVDEGLLNALLDDELDERDAADVRVHLERCDSCRALLTEARRQREQASAILQDADPNLAIPPFEHVLERAAGQANRHKAARLSRVQSLAVAATVVLAVAVGWYARGRQATARESGETTTFVDTTMPTLTTAERDRLQPQTAPVEERQRTMPRPREQESKVVPAPAPAEEPAELVEEREAARSPTLVVQAGQAKMQQTALDSFAGAVTAREAAIDEVSVATPLADSPLSIRGARDSWVRADRATARAFIGGPIAIVEGLSVLSYEVRTSEDGRPLTRVTQRLPSGDPVSLVQQRPAAPAEGEQRADRARRENVVAARAALTALTDRRGEYLVTIQAAIPADSLRVLLRKVK